MILAFKIGFLEMRWIDLVDIFLVAFLLFQLYKLLKGSIALRVFIGFLFLYLIYLVVSALQMELLSSILGQFMGVGVLAVIILFQQELRRFLLILGRTTTFNKTWLKKLKISHSQDSTRLDTHSIVEATKILSKTKTGAIMVFARSSELKFYAESGDKLDAVISKRLIQAIFNKNSPLHDGAIIIVKNKIKAARCILPVTENDDIPAQFGLRHRAAIGITEATDSVTLVVSEETGSVSIVKNGEITHDIPLEELKNKLEGNLRD